MRTKDNVFDHLQCWGRVPTWRLRLMTATTTTSRLTTWRGCGRPWGAGRAARCTPPTWTAWRAGPAGCGPAARADTRSSTATDTSGRGTPSRARRTATRSSGTSWRQLTTRGNYSLDLESDSLVHSVYNNTFTFTYFDKKNSFWIHAWRQNIFEGYRRWPPWPRHWTRCPPNQILNSTKPRKLSINNLL